MTYVNPAYTLIKEYYGDRVAERSQVPLIRHIDEGLVILERINASDAAKRAFCLHPIFQHPNDLLQNVNLIHERPYNINSPYVMALVFEYRNVANAFLSEKVQYGQFKKGGFELSVPPFSKSPLKDVNDMLIADKVQNYKDFLQYHEGKHQRSAELNLYFNAWLNKLEIGAERFQELCCGLDHYHTHMTHCNMGDYEDSCCYGDWETCPALT